MTPSTATVASAGWLDVLGIGLVGPGLPDWSTAAGVLRAPGDWRPTPTVVPAPACLPPTERRRAGAVVKAALVAAEAACAAAGVPASRLPTVFTSSTGEPANCHQLCEALAAADRLVSPTKFTNSVHNAAAGYWHIAVQSMQPSTSLGAYDASVAAGLLEAVAQALAGEGGPVLLVATDVPYPVPLHALRPVADTLSLALVLAPPGVGAAPIARLRLAAFAGPDATGPAPTPAPSPALEALRTSIPAGRALPLLATLADPPPHPATVVVEGLAGADLAVEVVAVPRAASASAP